ncbi:MAG: hypothetical protein ABJM06_09430 [Gilvibacter sp.]
MTLKTSFKTILVYLPSLMICLFYVPNGLDKILHHDSADKIIASSAVMIITGIVLLGASVMFLINKTMLWGAAILSLYMTMIVFIHMYKGKPYEVTILIVMATIFAAYIRRPEVFSLKRQGQL